MSSLDAKSERFILVKLLNKIRSECEELLEETINDKTKKMAQN
jgi:hypothetical protein